MFDLINRVDDIKIIKEHITNACDEVGKLLKYNLDKSLFDHVSSNLSGDKVKQIDLLCHNIFEKEFRSSDLIGGMASEEADEAIIWDENKPYIINCDPLDGSANVANNLPIGSIFSIYKSNGKITKDTFLQLSSEIILAGYSLYGPSNSLIIATDSGVNEYKIINGEAILYTQDIKCPEDNFGIFSMNPSNYDNWTHTDRHVYLEVMGKCESFRYVGALVCETNRTLFNGGAFVYPSDLKNKDGKLRLLYECIPIAYIFSKANGYASDGYNKLLDIKPTSLHQKSPLYLCSKKVSKLLKHFIVF